MIHWKWSEWDRRFMSLASHIAEWSKDPSTQTGCVIVRPDRTIASVGYNGFPRGVNDDWQRLDNREIKYAMTVHAEVNAIIAAHAPVEGCTLYCMPWPPCADCAGAIIQAGITRVVSIEPTDAQLERWGGSFQHMRVMFREAGVRLDAVPARWMA